MTVVRPAAKVVVVLVLPIHGVPVPVVQEMARLDTGVKLSVASTLYVTACDVEVIEVGVV